MEQSAVDNVIKQHNEFLLNELNNWDKYEPERNYFERQWKGVVKAKNEISVWNTGLDIPLLGFIGQSSVTYPKDFVSFHFIIFRQLLKYNVIMHRLIIEHPSTLAKDACTGQIEEDR